MSGAATAADPRSSACLPPDAFTHDAETAHANPRLPALPRRYLSIAARMAGRHYTTVSDGGRFVTPVAKGPGYRPAGGGAIQPSATVPGAGGVGAAGAASADCGWDGTI